MQRERRCLLKSSYRRRPSVSDVHRPACPSAAPGSCRYSLPVMGARSLTRPRERQGDAWTASDNRRTQDRTPRAKGGEGEWASFGVGRKRSALAELLHARSVASWNWLVSTVGVSRPSAMGELQTGSLVTAIQSSATGSDEGPRLGAGCLVAGRRSRCPPNTSRRKGSALVATCPKCLELPDVAWLRRWEASP